MIIFHNNANVNSVMNERITKSLFLLISQLLYQEMLCKYEEVGNWASK